MFIYNIYKKYFKKENFIGEIIYKKKKLVIYFIY